MVSFADPFSGSVANAQHSPKQTGGLHPDSGVWGGQQS
jgi:hypothetical protein